LYGRLRRLVLPGTLCATVAYSWLVQARTIINNAVPLKQVIANLKRILYNHVYNPRIRKTASCHNRAYGLRQPIKGSKPGSRSADELCAELVAAVRRARPGHARGLE
jgi:hypothetical protein